MKCNIKMKCNICEKEMVDPISGKSHVGITIVINGDAADTKEDLKFLQKQIGKYKMGKSYALCWECWMESMGMKP